VTDLAVAGDMRHRLCAGFQDYFLGR
jgi:hypothetical protein